MPLIYNTHLEQELGIRKVWIHPLADHEKAEHYNYETVLNMGHAHLFEGLTLDLENWYL
jgi:hypothetical protein